MEYSTDPGTERPDLMGRSADNLRGMEAHGGRVTGLRGPQVARALIVACPNRGVRSLG